MTIQLLLKQLPTFKSARVLTLGLLSGLLAASPGKAAEKIYFTYGPFSESLQISSLEKFAQTGQINSDLKFYSEAAIAEFRSKH